MQNQTVSILGCGWLGLPLAKALIKKGFIVKGSTTAEEHLEQLRTEGIEPIFSTSALSSKEMSRQSSLKVKLLLSTFRPSAEAI